MFSSNTAFLTFCSSFEYEGKAIFGEEQDANNIDNVKDAHIKRRMLLSVFLIISMFYGSGDLKITTAIILLK